MQGNSQLRRIVGDANRNLVYNFGCFGDSGRDYSDVGITADSTTNAGEQRAIHGAHSGLGLSGRSHYKRQIRWRRWQQNISDRVESYPKLLGKPRTLSLVIVSVEGERAAALLISARSKLLASSKSGLAASAVGCGPQYVFRETISHNLQSTFPASILNF